MEEGLIIIVLGIGFGILEYFIILGSLPDFRIVSSLATCAIITFALSRMA